MKKITLIIIIFLLPIGFISGMNLSELQTDEVLIDQEVEDSGSSGLERCRKDIQEAEDYDPRKMCTMQVKTMNCPHESGFTHRARNGCVISGLEKLGWNGGEVVEVEEKEEDIIEEEKAEISEKEKIQKILGLLRRLIRLRDGSL